MSRYVDYFKKQIIPVEKKGKKENLDGSNQEKSDSLVTVVDDIKKQLDLSAYKTGFGKYCTSRNGTVYSSKSKMKKDLKLKHENKNKELKLEK